MNTISSGVNSTMKYQAYRSASGVAEDIQNAPERVKENTQDIVEAGHEMGRTARMRQTGKETPYITDSGLNQRAEAMARDLGVDIPATTGTHKGTALKAYASQR